MDSMLFSALFFDFSYYEKDYVAYQVGCHYC